MEKFAAFKKIIRTDIPLAMHTWLQLGGRAEYFAEPQSEADLLALLKCCRENDVPVRILGMGTNVLVSDDGVPGMVIRLTAADFSEIMAEGNILTAGGGAKLGRAITRSVYEGLAGLEGLIGIPGTVGGAVRNNISATDGDIGQWIESVRVATYDGKIVELGKNDIAFGYRSSSLENAVILSCRFSLEPEDPIELAPRLQKLWIVRKKTQPMGHQGAGWLFKDPRGQSASELIEDAGLKGTRIGGAVICDRNPNFVIIEPECSSDDVKRLARLIQTQVRERSDVQLDLDFDLW